MLALLKRNFVQNICLVYLDIHHDQINQCHQCQCDLMYDISGLLEWAQPHRHIAYYLNVDTMTDLEHTVDPSSAVHAY